MTFGGGIPWDHPESDPMQDIRDALSGHVHDFQPEKSTLDGSEVLVCPCGAFVLGLVKP